MAQVPNEGIWLQSRDSATTSSALNYFYLRRPDSDHIPTVSGAIGTEDSGTSGPIELTLSTLNGADTGDQIWLKCHSILGTYEANGIWTATVIDSTHVELIGSSFSNSFDVSPDSQCMSVQLAATEEDHVTSTSGVELQDDDVHATLVGMCYVGASHTINDTSEKRDCASWYNRGIKTCVKSFASDHTTTSTSYTELSSEIECEFVTWGKGDPVGTEDLQWSISGMVKNNTGGDGAALSVRFDAMTPVEPQETGMINSIVATNGLPFSDSGSKSDLTEGKHYATLVGKAITGGTVTVFGNTAPAASLTVRIPQ